MSFAEHQQIYVEGEEAADISFLIKGCAAFVLPSFNNVPYIKIDKGNYFGMIDIIISSSQFGDNFHEIWYEKKSMITRQFTIQSQDHAELLSLGLKNLY